VTPKMIQAVAETRMADVMRAADRRRLVAAAAESRRETVTPLRSVRHRRRLRFGVA
jgi:hypothetical protein